MTAKKVAGRKPRQYPPIPPLPKVTPHAAPPPVPTAAERARAWIRSNHVALAVGAGALAAGIVLAFVLAFVVGALS